MTRNDYRPHVDSIRVQYASYFGHGSGHGNNLMASLQDVERYLNGEIQAIAQDVVDEVESPNMCGDGCFEEVLLWWRQEQERRLGRR